MKVNEISQNNIIQRDEKTNFKGFGDVALRFFATNQAVGANCIDLASMVIPRTATDMINRGPLAGLETLRREIMGTINDTLIGVYGIFAGGIIALLMGINKTYGSDVNKIMAAPETVKILAKNKTHQISTNSSQTEYLKESLRNLKAYNPASAKADKDGFVRISEDIINDVSKLLDNAISDKNMSFDKWKDIKTNDSLHVALNKITESTGIQSKYVFASSINGKDGVQNIVSETKLETFLEDIFKVSKEFNRPEVEKTFKEQIASKKNILENDFVKSLLKFNKTKAIGGFAIAALVGTLVQPINMYLTKKKTGSDGFVGVEGRSKDDSTGFKILKGLTAAAFGTMVLKTMKTGLKGFFDKMAFHGFWPTINQLKGVYGITIISRLFSARDKDELRESSTKDTLGFLSWLVFGDIINRMVAERMDNTVMNRSKDIENKNFFSRAFNSSLKNRDEILIETLANNGKTTIVEKDGKRTAMTFKEMLRELDKLPENIKSVTKKRMRTLNLAQLSGYLFSGLVLGIGIPRLNIYITNKLDKKKKAQAKQAETVE